MGSLLNDLIRYLESREDKVIGFAIYSVGAALILDSVLELRFSVLDYKVYQYMFQWLTPQMIFIRYCISVIWRCTFILALIGICFRLDLFRKFLIVLTWAEVPVLLWKHPYQAIINADLYAHTNLQYFYYTFHLPWSSQQYYPFIIISKIELLILDAAKIALILYFFSSPKVLKFFK